MCPVDGCEFAPTNLLEDLIVAKMRKRSRLESVAYIRDRLDVVSEKAKLVSQGSNVTAECFGGHWLALRADCFRDTTACVSMVWPGGQESEDPDPNDVRVSLNGEDSSPFGGLILEGLGEDDTDFFRDLHIQLRISYRTNETAKVLAAKLGSTDLMRHQIVDWSSQLG